MTAKEGRKAEFENKESVQKWRIIKNVGCKREYELKRRNNVNN